MHVLGIHVSERVAHFLIWKDPGLVATAAPSRDSSSQYSSRGTGERQLLPLSGTFGADTGTPIQRERRKGAGTRRNAPATAVANPRSIKSPAITNAGGTTFDVAKTPLPTLSRKNRGAKALVRVRRTAINPASRALSTNPALASENLDRSGTSPAPYVSSSNAIISSPYRTRRSTGYQRSVRSN